MKHKLILFTILLAALHAADASSKTSPSNQPRTFCNPLPIPNYPIGIAARKVMKGDPLDLNHGWRLDRKEQFRELCDPSASWLDGNWYLYPSVDAAWVSADNGATWQHHPLNLRDLGHGIGYGTTVVKHRGRFLSISSFSNLYASASPLGPFVSLGHIQITRTAGMADFHDPMLFSDDDGRLYYYWGASERDGIWAAELDAADPIKAITPPAKMIAFQPDEHPWECMGEWNQVPNKGWLEAAWLLKRNGRYFLTYAAGGGHTRSYAMGCYLADSPLGPFTPQKRNPILRSTAGLLTGTSNGSIAAGPDGKLWAFYSVHAGVAHGFEKRMAMDRVEIDANGELFIPAVTSLPQWLPGKAPAGAKSADTGWLPINGLVQTLGSTSAPNLQGRFAVDNEMCTWWQPAKGDAQPTLTSTFRAPATIYSVRLIWRDIGLDTNRGVTPGPFRYRVELETAKDQWTTIIDRSQSAEDLLIDYSECKPTTGTRARLVIIGWPKGITPGVAEFTVFGKTIINQ